MGASRALSWWWALPGLLLLLLVHYVSVALGGMYAFTDWRGIGDFDFVGFANFARILSDPITYGALANTAFFAFFYLILANAIGLLLAIGLNRALKAKSFLRSLIFLPAVLSPLAVGYIWRFIFTFDGPANDLVVGLWGEESRMLWLADVAVSRWVIVLVMVWQNVGVVMVIYLAGLANVPPELEEAAAVDGASSPRRFVSIVLPSLRPTVIIVCTLLLITGLRVFDEIIALTGGGPYGATETLSTQVWRQSFVAGEFGYGSAIAMCLTVLILILAITQNTLLRERRKGE
ncbi:carbohydrate ABC transporter permease [Microbacterium aurantiacum]|uniref:carbohydrate ABC transporter permease n=1 Tax=Microbacterium aurantiacum TaxID=162393 RepID=UPI00287B7F94|nr:sugar ABC transporter permease [Microbacterium aurantiacum]